MAAGILAISLSCGYIFYMNLKSKNNLSKDNYVAMAEDGTLQIETRKSRWE